MQTEIVLGPEAKAMLAIAGGKVIMGVKYAGAQASANVGVELDIEAFAKLLKDAIPGKIDDSVIDLLVAAMKVA